MAVESLLKLRKISLLSLSERTLSIPQIVRIARLPDGRIVFPAHGNARAGLRHIVKEHGEDFARRGIAESQIPDVIMDALQQGERVGTRRADVIYRMTIDGRSQHILIVVGSNGYIVTAYPFTF